MAIMKEWRCAAHGTFEGTHPICPAMGCESADVQRVFLTPVSISKGQYRQHEAGLRRSADVMGITDWKTAREGETGFHGRSVDSAIGSKVLWGDEVGKTMGRPMMEQVQAAQQPLALDRPGDPFVTVNSGMRAAANTVGITQRRLPQAEITGSLHDRGGR